MGKDLKNKLDHTMSNLVVLLFVYLPIIGGIVICLIAILKQQTENVIIGFALALAGFIVKERAGINDEDNK